jgi:GDP-4-dehydro-6-deoxy-D-mannose reductase
VTRILVTGASGFIGRHLCADLVRKGHQVTGTFLAASELRGFDRSIPMIKVDVRNRAQLESAIRASRPETVYHLAGQAYVLDSYRDPVGTFETNVIGTIHLFELLRKRPPLESIVVACTGAAYGLPERTPIDEGCLLRPIHPYGASKAAQDILCYQYAKNFEMPIVRARLFGTTGPGKRGDAINDFAVQLREFELHPGGSHDLRVGNLRKDRDISDVRDIIRAMELIGRRADPGEAVNLGAGQAYRIGSLLKQLIRLFGIRVRVRSVPELIRPTDEPRIVADITRLRSLGFRPKYSMDRTLRDVATYWRSATSATHGR